MDVDFNKLPHKMKEKLTIVKVGGAVVEDEAQLAGLLKDFDSSFFFKQWNILSVKSFTKTAELFCCTHRATCTPNHDPLQPQDSRCNHSGRSSQHTLKNTALVQTFHYIFIIFKKHMIFFRKTKNKFLNL